MPLEGLFDTDFERTLADPRERIYSRFGVTTNPFPGAAETSEHPHLDTEADAEVDRAIKGFMREQRSKALAVTASQGIGKTNLLNAYEDALQQKLKGRGYYIIRYMPDPEPSFDPLVRSIFEQLGEDHLLRLAQKAAKPENHALVAQSLGNIFGKDVRSMLEGLIESAKSEQDGKPNKEKLSLAYAWLLGLPARKAHREALNIHFRLDSVESRTRALREVVYFSAELGELKGIFLLLDELEKHGSTYPSGVVMRYLAALRALIDALPKYLFLMVALTTDALERYREMLPALKGRLANEIRLYPIRDENEAIAYWRFYLGRAKEQAQLEARKYHWPEGSPQDVVDVVTQPEARRFFIELKKVSSIDGVRQRDFLDQLHRSAEKQFEDN